ncbi:MAG: enoyl-CoA hydratase/isomerase family protein [Sphaerochaetaceae bacterium]|nr:enoyl-CoA hydratase/isomerase family protein [Sphaerochaetaceae bacterium]
MAKQEQLTYEISNGVMTITIDNPEMKNGLNYIGINQFADAMEVLNNDSSIKVAVIKGSNGYFFTGGRVDPNAPGEQELYSKAIGRYTKACNDNKKPIVAAINGLCLKAGMGTVAKADFAIALKGIEFGLPEIKMGGVPMMVMGESMEALPKKVCMEACLTAWNFSAERAYEIGFINAIADEKDFDATVQKYVDVFLNTPAELLYLTRKAYEKLSEIPDMKGKQEFGMKMLSEECLPAMTRVKQQYNV